MAFHDIQITGMDEGNTYPVGEGMYNIALKLSPHPTVGWSEDFDRLWTEHMYQLKRRARVESNRIMVTAPLASMDNELLEELKKVVAQANTLHHTRDAEIAEANRRLQEADAKERTQIADLANKLKF